MQIARHSWDRHNGLIEKAPPLSLFRLLYTRKVDCRCSLQARSLELKEIGLVCAPILRAKPRREKSDKDNVAERVRRGLTGGSS